jgi:hypothetical protein
MARASFFVALLLAAAAIAQPAPEPASAEDALAEAQSVRITSGGDVERRAMDADVANAVRAAVQRVGRIKKRAVDADVVNAAQAAREVVGA